MANNLIPEELDALIQEYLTDGVLTGKEREVILKKAEKMGLDRDEIDLYLDAQIQKMDQKADTAIRRQKGKVCPFCGAPVPQLADKCPECGQYITPEASEELQEIFDRLEEALIKFKSEKDFKTNKAIAERYVRKAKMYYENNPKVKKLLQEVEEEISLIDKKNQKEAWINYSIKNKWFWVICVFVVALILYINSDNEREEETAAMIATGGVCAAMLIGLSDLIKMKQAEENKNESKE